MRILSGIQPSGDLHIGNYFGMMRPCLDLQTKGETILFIADYHALTQLPDPDVLRRRVTAVAIDFLSCGLDPTKTIFFRQSEIQAVAELAWVLSNLTTVGLLERCHSYKDKISQGIAPNFGLFSYPVLMAADILLYQANLVPVGRDQKQHLEVTRDIVIRFNNRYGEVLVVPEEIIQENVAIIPGIDGRKMSKSYDNTIEIFGDEKALRKKIMKMVTDSTPVEQPKNPDSCNVFALYKLFASQEELASMRQRYTAGGMGYGHAKQELFEKYWEYFKPYRKKREELTANLDYVNQVLSNGAERARAIATSTMTKVKAAIGLS